MDTAQAAILVRKLDNTLSSAQRILKETHVYEMPVVVIQILCIVYRNHMLGKTTYYNELEKELHMTTPNVSRLVSRLAVWSNLKTRGAGYLDKDKDYNDAGRQVTAIRMTEKGIAIMHRIVEPMQ